MSRNLDTATERLARCRSSVIMPPTADTEALPDIDYLLIGHVTKDLTPQGPTIGGTVSYAGLTARGLGLRVGAITSAASDVDLSLLGDIALHRVPAEHSTTFENRYTPRGREQILLARARLLGEEALPRAWRTVGMVHLGPIADEITMRMVGAFGGSRMCLTPQGWLRRCDERGRIHLIGWNVTRPLLPLADAVVVSIEDLGGDAKAGAAMAGACRLLAVTEGPRGATVFWKGQARQFPAPKVEEVDPTGAGDIFAAVFFTHFCQTGDAWEAARFANQLAAISVTRRGISSVPMPCEVQAARRAAADRLQKARSSRVRLSKAVN